MKKQIKKNKKGFTLVEMIVVIAIIGVLAAMMVPSLLGFIDKANTSNNRAAATSIGRAAQGVILELNQPSTNDMVIEFTTSDSKWKVGSTVVAAALTGAERNDTNARGIFVRDMVNSANPDGNVQITVVAGKVTKVIYSKTSATYSGASADSDKTFGIYKQ